MIKYELGLIEAFINEHIYCIPQKKITKIEFKALKVKIRGLVADVKNKMRSEHPSGPELADFIRSHQNATLYLKNALLEYMGKEHAFQLRRISTTPNSLNLCKYVYACLQDLLCFIDSYFSDWIHWDRKASIASSLIASKNMKQDVAFIRQRFADCKIGKELQALCLAPLLELVNDSELDDVAVAEIVYLESLAKRLQVFMPEADSDFSADEQLSEVLRVMNFNYDEFVDYQTEQWEQAVYSLENPEAQQERIVQMRRDNSKRKYARSKRYCHASLSIQEQLAEWLDREEHIITQQIERYTMQEQHRFVKSARKPGYKIPTTFTVEELAHFHLIFTEIGIFKPEVNEDMHHLVANSYRTKDQDNVSPGSVQRRYKECARNSVLVVRKALAAGVEYSRREFPY